MIFLLSFTLCLSACFSGGWITDKIVQASLAPETPPSITSVDDDIAFPSLTTTPVINWTSSFALVAGTKNFHYEISIGTAAGTTNVVPWTNIGLVTTWSTNTLALSVATQYFTNLRIIDSQGTVYSTQISDGWYTVTAVTSAPRYSIALQWGSYQKIGPEAACTGSGNYFTCVHGGEKRKVTVPAFISCTNLSITDELGAFDWECDDNSGAGPVNFSPRRDYSSKRSH